MANIWKWSLESYAYPVRIFASYVHLILLICDSASDESLKACLSSVSGMYTGEIKWTHEESMKRTCKNNVRKGSNP